MNNKGQGKVGFIIIAFIVVIVGLGLMVPIATNVGGVTKTRTITNQSFTVPAANTTTAITGQANTTAVTIYLAQNGTNNISVAGSHFTVSSNQNLNGVYTATISFRNNSYYGNTSWLTYTFQPDGYLDASGRAIAPLILLFFALGIAIVMLTPAMRNGLMEIINK